MDQLARDYEEKEGGGEGEEREKREGEREWEGGRDRQKERLRNKEGNHLKTKGELPIPVQPISYT